jgi:hypothetical protein
VLLGNIEIEWKYDTAGYVKTFHEWHFWARHVFPLITPIFQFSPLASCSNLVLIPW